MTTVAQVFVEGKAVQMGWDWDPKIALSIYIFIFAFKLFDHIFNFFSHKKSSRASEG